jgi:O-antigen ligase
LTTTELEGKRRRRVRSFDATALLTVFVVLLMVIPSQQAIGVLALAPAAIIGILALLWWFGARINADSGMARGYQPVRIGLYLFVAAVLISYALCFHRFLAPDEVRSADRFVLFTAAFAGVVLLAADGITDLGRLDRLLRRFTLLGAAVGVLGILQFFTGFDITPLFKIPGLRSNDALSLIGARDGFRRVAGTAAHPIEFGVLMAMLLPLALHYAFTTVDRRTRERWWYVVAILACGIMMSLSRSGVVAAAVGLMIVGSTWPWRRVVNALVAGVLFLGAMRLLIPGLVGSMTGLFTHVTTDDSTTGRTARYPAAFHLIHQYPWFGRGPGTLLPSHILENKVAILDNQYLGSTIETGVIGLVALITMLLIGTFTARGARRRSSDPVVRSLAQALAGSIAGCLVAFYTFDALSFPKVAFGVALLIGCAGALWRLAPSIEPESSGARVLPLEQVNANAAQSRLRTASMTRS